MSPNLSYCQPILSLHLNQNAPSTPRAILEHFKMIAKKLYHIQLKLQ